MAKTIEQLKKQHPQYQQFAQEYKKFREAYSGGVDFKNDSNIRKFYADRADDFQSILGVTPTTNLCRHLIENRVNQVFATDPERALMFVQGSAILDIDTTPGLRSFLDDSTFTGQEFKDFMEEVATQSSIYGHCWVMLEKPSEQEIDTLNFDQNRPYVQIVLPQQVIDWEYKFLAGREVLTSIKIVLNETPEEVTIYQCELQEESRATLVETYTISKAQNDKEEVYPTTSVLLPEGMGIPCFKSYAKRDPSNKTVGLSDIRDAVYFQRFIANLDREAYESVIYKKSILKLPVDIQTPEGGGMGIVRGEVEELDAVDFAVPDTADVDSVRAYIDNVLERYSKLSGLQSQTGMSARSGESFFQERQELYRQASQKARSLEQTEIGIFMLFAHWQGLKFAGYIQYDTNYSDRDVELRLYNLQKAKTMAPDSPVINEIIERELIAIIGNEEDKKKAGLFKEFEPVVSELPNPFEDRKGEEEEEVDEDQPRRSIKTLNNGTYDESIKVGPEFAVVKP